MEIKLIRKNLIEIDSVKFGVNFQWSSPILEKSKLKRRLKEEEFIRSSESNIGTYLKMEGDRFQLGMADKEYDGTNSLAAYFSGDKNTVYVIKIDEERFWHASYDSNGFIYIFSDKILSIHELSDSIREFISLSNESSKIKIVSLGGYFIFEDSNLEVIHERRGNEYTFYDPLRIKNSITEVKSVNLKRSIATSIGGALFVIVGGGYLYLSSGNGEYNKIVNGDYSSPANIEYNKVTKEIKKVNSVSGGFDENSFVKESVVDFHKYKLFTPQNAGSMIDIMMELRGKTPHIINGWDLISLTYEGANVYLNFSRAKGAPNSSNYKELDLVLIDKLSAYGYKVTPIRIQDKGDKRSYIVDLFKPSEKYYKYLSEVERIDNLKKELKDKINKYKSSLDLSKRAIENIEYEALELSVLDKRSKSKINNLVASVNDGVNQIKSLSKKTLDAVKEYDAIEPIDIPEYKGTIVDSYYFDDKIVPMLQDYKGIDWSRGEAVGIFPKKDFGGNLQGKFSIVKRVTEVSLVKPLLFMDNLESLIRMDNVFLDEFSVSGSGLVKFNLALYEFSDDYKN